MKSTPIQYLIVVVAVLLFIVAGISTRSTLAQQESTAPKGPREMSEVLRLIQTFDQQKADALQKYLADNPDSKEADMALTILISTQVNLGNYDTVIDNVEKRFELMEKNGMVGPDVEMILNQILQPLVEAAIVTDQRQRGLKFVERFKAFLSKAQNPKQLHQIVDQMSMGLSSPQVGDLLEFSFIDRMGNEVDLAKMRGKIVLVDFWATWCPPCVAEMPEIANLYTKYKDKGFEVVGVSLDESQKSLEDFLKLSKITWPQHFDGRGYENEIASKYGISVLPTTYLLDREGKIIESNIPSFKLEEVLTGLLE